MVTQRIMYVQKCVNKWRRHARLLAMVFRLCHKLMNTKIAQSQGPKVPWFRPPNLPSFWTILLLSKPPKFKLDSEAALTRLQFKKIDWRRFNFQINVYLLHFSNRHLCMMFWACFWVSCPSDILTSIPQVVRILFWQISREQWIFFKTES